MWSIFLFGVGVGRDLGENKIIVDDKRGDKTGKCFLLFETLYLKIRLFTEIHC